VLSVTFQGFGSIASPEMSETGLTVPDMNEPLNRYNVTVTARCDGGCLPDPAAFTVAAERAARSRSASIISVHLADKIISVVTVTAPDRYAAMTVAQAVVSDALKRQALVIQPLASGNVRIDADGGLAALDNPSGNTAWISAVTTVVFPMLAAFWLAFAGRLVLSWRRSGGERRQQLKWLLSGVAAALAGGLIGIFTDNIDPHAPAAVQAIAHSLTDAGVVVFAVCVGVAILKYRLYDIDRIISRTLAYTIVTGLLAGMYAGLVLLTTQVFRVHTPVAVAASTLAAAALFSPLRRRVQLVVDRRFNRARYDADQTVAAFATRLKDAVNLDSVRDDLTAVVDQALEPAHVSVWISSHG